MNPDLSPEEIGQLIARKRGSMGIRAAAKEIGTSPATLSRIENGHLSDMETMKKVFAWAELDARGYFGFGADAPSQSSSPEIQIMFKAKKSKDQKTAQALGQLILAAYNSFEKEIKSASH
ncbi:MAG: helix-turn-helix transcriptional regulator [Alphaproteobacteria bacterium]|nr:helix-turn-helix transcriptional regulator [Alphaproteobacteria bacterium]